MVVIWGISVMRLPQLCLALSLVLAGVSPPCARAQGGRSWEDCLKAPDRACVLDQAIGLVDMLDRTDWRQALIEALPDFRMVNYRRSGSRGPAGRLLYDSRRIPDPAGWLRERLGEVEILKS